MMMVNRVEDSRKPRVRRSVEDARRQILDAAERRLIEGGPDSVRVQLVAGDVGLTDAALHYHFGNRDGLLEALLRHAGRRLKDELTRAVGAWDPGTLDVAELARLIQKTFDTDGYARLSGWMTLAGWKPREAGMFRRLAEAIHLLRVELATGAGDVPPSLEDTLFSIELLNLVIWGEALTGHAFRRSVGLRADQATAKRFMDWFTALLGQHLRGDVAAPREWP